MPSLGASFGRGAATMAQWDLANADCVLVMGSNMAENHPIAFRFVMQAKERGATVIHADPRFTRTSALADIHAPLRAGSDVAFLGGIIHHLLENDLWFRDWALEYTNLATIIGDDYRDAADGEDGLFSGWDPDEHMYSPTSWQYRGFKMPSPLAEHYVNTEQSAEHLRRMCEGPPQQDRSLQHPNCVYQILRRHYAAYTPEMVERVTGCPRDVFLRVADALACNSGRERTGAICYAVGWTHHTTGVQMIRAAAIIQALLGNVGRPGGGILALRGHCSIQGSTDVPALYNLLPGYLAQPHVFKPHETLAEYLKTETAPTGYWHNLPKFVVSLLRAWYGGHARADDEWGYQRLPKMVADHSQLPMTLAMRDGTIRGLFVLGQNPVVGGSNSRLVQRGLAQLEWLVVRDVAETETASFWYQGHPVRAGEMRPQDIATEVFLMPAALAGEKAGSFTNTHRLVQWHDKVVDAPGDSRSELWFLHELGCRLRAAYADSDAPADRGLRELTWDYPLTGERREPDAEAVLREINGYGWPDRRQLDGPSALKDDGSTACGVWIYSGVYTAADGNRARAREPDGPQGPGTHLGWGFAWPANRRTLYNRASADPEGRAWSERKKLIVWDAGQRKWTGPDAIDFETDKPPDYRPDWDRQPTGTDALSGADPFIMIADGKCSIFVPSGLRDAPLPTHYEPRESPLHNPMYRQQSSPTARSWARSDNPYHPVADPRWPHVLTTYRLTEHHSGGLPTRMVAVLSELQPAGFAEISPELAAELDIANLDWVVLSTARGEIETRALVTERLRPFAIDGRRIHQIGMPFHFGWRGFATGDIANVLTSIVGDANTSMHENKALTCALRKGRLARPGGVPTDEVTP